MSRNIEELRLKFNVQKNVKEFTNRNSTDGRKANDGNIILKNDPGMKRWKECTWEQLRTYSRMQDNIGIL